MRSLGVTGLLGIVSLSHFSVFSFFPKPFLKVLPWWLNPDISHGRHLYCIADSSLCVPPFLPSVLPLFSFIWQQLCSTLHLSLAGYNFSIAFLHTSSYLHGVLKWCQHCSEKSPLDLLRWLSKNGTGIVGRQQAILLHIASITYGVNSYFFFLLKRYRTQDFNHQLGILTVDYKEAIHVFTW